jgi:hypothetical protein
MDNIYNGFEKYINNGELTRPQVIIIKWQYNYLGGFYKHLIKLFLMADDENWAHLWSAFPEVGTALDFYRNGPGWWDECQQLAGKLGLAHFQEGE